MPTLAAPKAATETASPASCPVRIGPGLAVYFNYCEFLFGRCAAVAAAAAPTAVAAVVSAFIAVVVVVLLARSPPLSVGHFVLNMNMANDVTSHVMSRHMQKVPSSLPLFLSLCVWRACVCC